MPTFSNRLPTEKKHMGFDLLRTPTGRPMQAIVTCENMVVCDTHFWGGRTIPCERQTQAPDGTLVAGDCPACRESVPFRTHAYVSAVDCKTKEHFIFECTSHAAKPLEHYQLANDSLRGCLFRAQRPKAHANAKVVIETSTANLSTVRLPQAPDLILALTTIWRLPTEAVRREKKKHELDELRMQKQPLDRMRTQPDNQPEPVPIGDVLKDGDGRPKPACIS